MSLDSRIAEAVRCLDGEYRGTLEVSVLEAAERQVRQDYRAARRARFPAALRTFFAALRGLLAATPRAPTPQAPLPRAPRGQQPASVWPA